MDINDFMNKLLEILPNAIFDQDSNGEIIVATGFTEEDGKAKSMFD